MRHVTLTGPNPLLLTEMLDPAAVPTIEVPAELHLPAERAAPVPGVVVLNGLGGPKRSREGAYGRKLAGEGYAALVIDSFAPRGVGANGDLIRALSVTEVMMLADAFSGLRHLAALPRVDAARIGVIGFSYGGMVSVLAAYEQIARLFLPEGPRFRTHLSYYGCSIPRMADPTTTGAPVAILLGGRDRNVSLPRSEAIAADLRKGGSDADVQVFEPAYHQWDGSDETRRFVPFNLRRLHVRVFPDQEVRDERTRLRMAGRVSRAAIIGIWTDPTGYRILRDEETCRRTDDILLATLAAM